MAPETATITTQNNLLIKFTVRELSSTLACIKSSFSLSLLMRSNILYDLHPLIMMGDFNMNGKGFFGFNYHWGKVRQYTFPEVQDGFYEVTTEEFNTLRSINYARFIQN